jgi:hypothetical protein
MTVNNTVPLASGFKPAMKVLSRKPAPQMIVKKDPVTGLEQLTLQKDEDESDPESNKKQPTIEEIRLRQHREREEKQRRYDEARAKIFGDSNPSSGQSTPGNVTPPQASDLRQSSRGRGRGRGAVGVGSVSGVVYRNDNRPDGQSRRPPNTNAQPGNRELFDPNYSPKPGLSFQKPNSGSSSPQPKTTMSQQDDQVIRAPRGPDSSGRGGFGFARRGANEG